MRRIPAVVVALSLPLLAGCPSTESLCRSGVDQVCERVFECQSAQAKASPQFQAAFGTSVESCKELLYANPLRPQHQTGIACAEVDGDEDLCVNLARPDATAFDLGKAQECSNTRADLSCQEYLAQVSDATLAPAACAQRCTP